MFRFSKKGFTDFTRPLASDAGRRIIGKSMPFDPIKQAMSTSAKVLEVDEDKKTTILPEIRRHAEHMYPAKGDKQDNRMTTPEKSVDLKQKDDETPLRPSLQLGIDNFRPRLQEVKPLPEDSDFKRNGNMQERRNESRKEQDKQKSMMQVKIRFKRIKAPPQVEARFQEEKKAHYYHLAKARGMSVEEYFEKLDQKSLEISEDKEICTRIDGDILKKILKENDPNKRRFMSQFETGISNALLDLDFYKRRIVERNTLGNYDLETTDNGNRIIYGYLAKPDQVRGPYDEQGKYYRTDQYGDVVIVFEKTEELKRRTSFTVGDSLDYTGRVRGVPYENPNGDCFAWGKPRWPDEVDSLNIKGEFDPLNIEEFDALPVYVEAQIHYGVSLKQVARVVLTGKSAQDQELIDLLREHKISVMKDLSKF